ncbi:hypothetical protein N826_02145 [Skermanella aerolata KACC 11604]|nr:hypothetical protein N826_02145 [Skermanella aerolata KACC 11604]
MKNRASTLRQRAFPPMLRRNTVDLTDATELDKAAIDIMLDFRSRMTPLKLDRLPRYGIWTMTIDHAAGDAALLAVLDGFATGRRVFEVALVSTADAVSDPRVLRKGTIGSEETLERTLNDIYDAVSGWPFLALRLIQQGQGPIETDRAPALLRANKPAAGILSGMLRSELRRATNLMKRWFLFETWNIGICDVPIEAFLDPAVDPDPVWLKPPRKYSYYADPFPVPDRDGELLCEFLDATTDYKGRIVRIGWDGSGNDPKVSDAIDRAYHLSYPYQFTDGGQTFCLPEAYQSGRLDLLTADAEGGALHEVATLLEVPAVDPVILRHADRWWLFCTLIEHQNSDLHIWYATSLTGPWTPHANNPVKTDVASARPGGTPFVSGGRLYRPAQDCSMTYGGALSLMEIIQLDEKHFSERLVRRIVPPKGPYRDGTHTLSACGARTLIDAKRYHFAGTLFLRKVVARVRGIR